MGRPTIQILRVKATEACDRGRYDQALASYLELVELEPGEPGWRQRAAECYRRLGMVRDQRDQLERAIEVYVERGMLLKAVALCNVLLRIDPEDRATRARLARLQGERDRGLARFHPTPA